jgi:2'-5' RNA ligase
MSQNQGEMVRSFIAINLPEVLQDNISSLADRFRKRLKHGRTRVTWVKSGSIHLTLKFLGSIETELVPSILERLEEAASGIRPFSIVLGDLGVFPNLNQPRVIWVGVQKGEEEVCILQKRVEDGLSKLGFKVEKRVFSPHLTLGRIKALGSRGEVLRALNDLKDPEIGGTEVTQVALMKSTLTPQGAIYTELGSVRLKNS